MDRPETDLLAPEDGASDSALRVLVADHRIITLVVGASLIGLIFVTIGLILYNANGTAQLDLSRPGYEGVGEQVRQDKTVYTEFPASGPINAETFELFERLYREQMENAERVDAFGGDPLDAQALDIGEPVGETTPDQSFGT